MNQRHIYKAKTKKLRSGKSSWPWTLKRIRRYDTKNLNQKRKKKSRWLDFTKIKNICVLKNIIKKVKSQPTEREKIFANDLSVKGFVYEICKELQLKIIDK